MQPPMVLVASQDERGNKMDKDDIIYTLEEMKDNYSFIAQEEIEKTIRHIENSDGESEIEHELIELMSVVLLSVGDLETIKGFIDNM